MTSPTIAVPLLQRSARFLAVLTALATALALRPIILIMVTILALVTSSAVSLARPKKPSWAFCTCVCSTESGVHEGRTYDYPGGSCGKLDGIVCQIGDPSTGGIRTGSLFGCSPADIIIDEDRVEPGQGSQGGPRPSPDMPPLPGKNAPVR
jgi:hypothetical protein